MSSLRLVFVFRSSSDIIMLLTFELRHFMHLLMNNQMHLREFLRKQKIKTILCSRMLNYEHCKELVGIVGDDIKIYPPLSLQVRTNCSLPILPLTESRMAKARMHYFVRLDSVNNRVGVKKSSKVIKILYQTYECGNNRQGVQYNNAEYMTRDNVRLSREIFQKYDIPEFRFDFEKKTEKQCVTGHIVKLSFLSLEGDVPHHYDGQEKVWKLDSIGTWPSCSIDFPKEMIDENHPFVHVLEQFGRGVYQYLKFYGRGNHPA